MGDGAGAAAAGRGRWWEGKDGVSSAIAGLMVEIALT